MVGRRRAGRRPRTVSYQLSSAGHWYGGGETSEGAAQPYPLDAGQVSEPDFSPASYLMMEPYWYTSSSVGNYVRTASPMDVQINKSASGLGDFTIKSTDSYASTVFVESTPSAVYQDYVEVVGKPSKSDATPAEIAQPLWNSWAQFYTAIDQNKVLDWAGKLHAAGLGGHTIQLDDKWESNYGNLTFDPKTFPNPKAMSDQIHSMGYHFGLWTTLWINLDSANYAYAKDHGYLLAAAADSTKPCTVTWWNGTAGIIDLGKPAARDWYTGNLHQLMSTYGVDGFKFDTRFFDDSCAPAAGVQAGDYQRLGAEMADGFDLQGAGVRVHWGNQKYGFVIRAVDAGTRVFPNCERLCAARWRFPPTAIPSWKPT
ncbi:TIM-barrel domain-containing protein [Fodinicola feengrottensis]|uniref:TIM-barrel domain-containing protein n=1 Tax=Fodinicola feengrottensis TaxID=435914 RepID=UPI002441738B|nr:TIM-barrel domain-containing protein [Fodinicola feengrottensis]